ncbi:hypothetical protein D3C72_1255980 [compost metagenome]
MGRDVAVPHYVRRLNAIALNDIAAQRDQQGYLLWREGLPMGKQQGAVESAIDYFNPYRGIVQVGSAAPGAGPGMPCAQGFRHQLKRHRFALY